MHFHLTHGSAVVLTEGQTLASRNIDTFCNGIVFSDQPVVLGQKLCVELGCTTTWSAGIRVGVTSVNPARLDPSELPRFAYPDLAHKEGFWVRAVNENHLSPGCRLTVYLTKHGQLQLFINRQHKGALLLGLPTTQSLWLMLDIYGNTCSAKFVKPGKILSYACSKLQLFLTKTALAVLVDVNQCP